MKLVRMMSCVRVAIAVCGVALGASAVAHAGPTPAGSGQTFEVDSGQCKTAARYQNLWGAGATGESTVDRGHCWHWVKLWIWDEHARRTLTQVAQGTKPSLFVLPVGPLRNSCRSARGSRGFYVTRAEFGACASAGHCTKKLVAAPAMPTLNC
jgi:hypothetical protein